MLVQTCMELRGFWFARCERQTRHMFYCLESSDKPQWWSRNALFQQVFRSIGYGNRCPGSGMNQQLGWLLFSASARRNAIVWSCKIDGSPCDEWMSSKIISTAVILAWWNCYMTKNSKYRMSGFPGWFWMHRYTIEIAGLAGVRMSKWGRSSRSMVVSYDRVVLHHKWRS